MNLDINVNKKEATFFWELKQLELINKIFNIPLRNFKPELEIGTQRINLEISISKDR